MAVSPLPHHKGDNRETVSSSDASFSSVNLSGSVITFDDSSSPVSPLQTPTKDVTGERVARFLRLTSSVSSPVTSPPLMKIVFLANLDRGVDDDNLRTVFLRRVNSRYSLGIKIEDYIKRDEGDEEQRDDDDDADDEDGWYDDQHYDELTSRTVKVKRDRFRKRAGRGFTKLWCVYDKHGLGLGIRVRC